MSAGGVIPTPEEREAARTRAPAASRSRAPVAGPYVREVGRVEGLEGSDIVVGVDYDSVVIDYGAPLNSAKAEEFGRLFVAACWEAGQNQRRWADGIERTVEAAERQAEAVTDG